MTYDPKYFKLIERLTYDRLSVIDFSASVQRYLDALKTESAFVVEKEYAQYFYNECLFATKHQLGDVPDTLIKQGFINPIVHHPNLLTHWVQQIHAFNCLQGVRKALETCQRHCEVIDLKVMLLPTHEYTWGFTFSSNLILLYVHCYETAEETLAHLNWTLAHEFAHAYHIQFSLDQHLKNPMKTSTVLEHMLFEGKANCFANALYGDVGPSYRHSEYSKSWTFYAAKLESTNYQIGSRTLCTLEHTLIDLQDVYHFGTQIVERTIQSLELHHPKDWIELSKDEFLQEQEAK